MSTVAEEGTAFRFHLPNFILHGPPFLPWRPLGEGSTFSVDPHTLVKAPILWNMTQYPVQSPHSSNHSCPLTITQWWRDMFADTHRLCTRSWTEKCGLHQMAFNCPSAKRQLRVQLPSKRLAPYHLSMLASGIFYSLILFYCKLWQCFQCTFPLFKKKKSTFCKFFKCIFSHFCICQLTFTVLNMCGLS